MFVTFLRTFGKQNDDMISSCSTWRYMFEKRQIQNIGVRRVVSIVSLDSYLFSKNFHILRIMYFRDRHTTCIQGNG